MDKSTDDQEAIFKKRKLKINKKFKRKQWRKRNQAQKAEQAEKGQCAVRQCDASTQTNFVGSSLQIELERLSRGAHMVKTALQKSDVKAKPSPIKRKLCIQQSPKVKRKKSQRQLTKIK